MSRRHSTACEGRPLLPRAAAAALAALILPLAACSGGGSSSSTVDSIQTPSTQAGAAAPASTAAAGATTAASAATSAAAAATTAAAAGPAAPDAPAILGTAVESLRAGYQVESAVAAENLILTDRKSVV